MKKYSILLFSFLVLGNISFAQGDEKLDTAIVNRTLLHLTEKKQDLGQQVEKVSLKALRKFKRSEERLWKKLYLKDSVLANMTIQQARSEYERVTEQVKKRISRPLNIANEYFPKPIH